MLRFDVAKHPHDLGTPDFRNGSRTKRGEDVALETPALCHDATQFFHVAISKVFVLDDPPQGIGTGFSLLSFISKRVAAMSNLAEDGLGLSLSRGKPPTAVAGYASRHAIGVAVLHDV